MNLNKVMLIGRLGRDPEISYSQNGKAVAKLNLATTEKWNDKQTGEKKEETQWHRITFYGKPAETLARYTTKGSGIYIEGKIKYYEYQKDGVTKYGTDIVGSSFQFLGDSRDKPFTHDQFQGTPQPGFYQQQQPPQQFQQQQHFKPAPQQQQQQQQPESFGAGFNTQKQFSPPDDDIPY